MLGRPDHRGAVQRLELEFEALELRLGAGSRTPFTGVPVRSNHASKRTAQNINSAFFATLWTTSRWRQVTSVVAIILVLMFFILGADANTYVLGNDDPAMERSSRRARG